MLTPAETYEDVCRLMRWRIPEFYNMGVDVCDKHAETTPDRVALIVEDEDGAVTNYSFRDIQRLSNRLANVLVARGLRRGDRVGVLLSQSVEAAVAHVAVWKAGFISIPLFTLFGEDALEFRLANSGTKAVITDADNLGKLEAIRESLPDLQTLIVAGAGSAGFPAPHTSIWDFWSALDHASDTFAPVNTKADDPGVIIYTSGTTGNPKGALHAHRILLGHQPSVEFFNEFFPQPGDLMWTPADWAWIGGLMNVLMSSWHHGVTVLAQRARKFDPEQALALMTRHSVRNTFMPPTALRLMRQVERPRERFGFGLRTLTCAGEPMGAELLDWCRTALGVTPNEYYGQTECNLVAANCAKIMDVKPGSMGRAVPGHTVEIIDDQGRGVPPGTVGQIAVRRPHPVIMLEYWRNPDATAAKYIGDWLLTGDEGHKDEDGYLWFLGRDDDVITSAGYRIGPGEIEDCLGKHPAVAIAAVIGVPDPLRTESVKAFIVLTPDHTADDALEEDIRAYVKTRLARHEYPRMIEFVDSLPMTATGKIRRRELRDQEIAKQHK